MLINQMHGESAGVQCSSIAWNRLRESTSELGARLGRVGLKPGLGHAVDYTSLRMLTVAYSSGDGLRFLVEIPG